MPCAPLLSCHNIVARRYFTMNICVKRICPFCKKEMGLVCICGAYQVNDESYAKPLKKQPYMDG